MCGKDGDCECKNSQKVKCHICNVLLMPSSVAKHKTTKKHKAKKAMQKPIPLINYSLPF